MAPVLPCGPVAPVVPAGPVGPGVPPVPVAPLGPASPVGPEPRRMRTTREPRHLEHNHIRTLPASTLACRSRGTSCRAVGSRGACGSLGARGPGGTGGPKRPLGTRWPRRPSCSGRPLRPSWSRVSVWALGTRIALKGPTRNVPVLSTRATCMRTHHRAVRRYPRCTTTTHGGTHSSRRSARTSWPRGSRGRRPLQLASPVRS